MTEFAATGEIALADTITRLPPEAAGAVVVSGSHGGALPGALALAAGVRAVVLNDAGGGLDGAGRASLPLCEAAGVAAATVGHESARIGDAADMLARGAIAATNAQAAACGVRPGMSCREAAEALRAAPLVRAAAPSLEEARRTLPGPGREVVLADSASLVAAEDAGRIVITGSHGALFGGDPANALKADAFAAAFNDAGLGERDHGASRLPALDGRGIAAFTVAAASARIGEAESTLRDGVISRVNALAAALGIREGMRADDAVARLRAM
jgi:uncharacterized protein YunC (DUF1805 family)